MIPASEILKKILTDGALIGSSRWTPGNNVVCFSEAPIHELNSVFSLNRIAASDHDKPRYEPYGIAVNKLWLYRKGGRPVIYDHPDALSTFPEKHRYRFATYDPDRGKDFTWEREWRIKTNSLTLDPKETLVIVPTADKAFDLVYGLAKDKSEQQDEHTWFEGKEAKWLAVSLDILGFEDVLVIDADPAAFSFVGVDTNLIVNRKNRPKKRKRKS